MRTTQKASVKAQAFASKIAGKEVAKSTTWATISDMINIYFPYVYDIRSNCKSQGDNTVIKIFKGDETATKDDLIETISIPNAEIFIEKEADWDWPGVYKLIVEYFMKNWKKLTSGKKAKKSKKEVAVNVNDLMNRVTELKDLIAGAKGKEKKNLIKEYNEKSVLLESVLEKNATKAATEAATRKASADEVEALRKKKTALYHKVRSWEKAGKDATDLKKELAEVTTQLRNVKTGRK